MRNLEQEVKAVQKLGEEIGYGNMMTIASSLWRKKLRDEGYPISGAFVPTCIGMFDKEGEDMAKDEAIRYDSFVDKALSSEQ